METLAELLFRHAKRPGVNPREAVATREKGGVRIVEAAFQVGIKEVLAPSRFTAR
ncbi:hypothetical protein ABIB73_003619 [Bradyrhizobium sp. F1.4.3]|uniref:hypothetical protein n=1 Tax=Bradyrhizobium sp. F1.4.3 TaxID=3156356 RepID=UPI0033911ECC